MLISIVSKRERERSAFQILKGESLEGPNPVEISIHHAKPQHSLYLRLLPTTEKKFCQISDKNAPQPL